MKPLLSLLALLTLAACGADGEPVRPTAATEVTYSSSGVYAQARVGITRGPLTVTLGL